MKRVRPGYYSPVTRRGTIAILLIAAFLVAIPATATAAGAGASRAGCPGQGNASAGAAAQERTMRCLVNRARHARGLNPLAALTSLNRAADRKSADVIRCSNSATKPAVATSPTG